MEDSKSIIKNRIEKKKGRISQAPLYIMVLPAIIIVFIYSYIPMAGIVIAFQDFIPAKGLFGKQTWVGFQNFVFLFQLPNSFRIFWNTIYIAVMKIISGLTFPVIIALLLNELRHKWYKRTVQTLIYLPNFLSWVIFAGILVDILSPGTGIINKMLEFAGIKPIYFLGNPKWFPYTMVITDVWKNFGFSTIVYLAAITNIDPTIYEAAYIDGANKWKQTIHVTLPGMKAIIVLVATLSLSNILNAGFEQIFNMYSPQVYETGDIIDTFVYRMGLINARYGLATAVGTLKSVVSCILISVSYYLAYKFADYRIF
ncbi:MAG: sugar ABC transporter permease [Firmicutes bacterium]|nr:sugar ABC transporter permease [Bacillota bacterium]